jgi:hypothetical protein
MPQINCYIPIQIRLTGVLSDDQLEKLGQTVRRAVQARLSLADRTIADRYRLASLDGEAEVREAFDPARSENGFYQIPSFDQPRRHVSMRLPESRRGRPWIVRKAVNFHSRVGAFLDFIESLQPNRTLESKVLYQDLFTELRWVSLWLVQVNQDFTLQELEEMLTQRATELSRVRAKQLLAYGLGTSEAIRQQLIELDEDHLVGHAIPSLATLNFRRIVGSGINIQVMAGGWVIFASMVLPRIELLDVGTTGIEVQVTLKLRDLGFLVPPDVFEQEFRISWPEYLQELGDLTETLHLQPVTIVKKVHFLSLQYLMEQLALENIRSTATSADAYYGRLFVLNQSALDRFPAAARSQVEALTDDTTRRLDNMEVGGHLTPGWKAVYAYTLFQVDEESIGTARYRPEARRLIPLLLGRLSGDTSDSDWQRSLYYFLRDTFGTNPPTERPAGGSVFEYVLQELESRGKFTHLFDKVEASNHFGMHHLLVRLALSTIYADHDRVVQSRKLLNRRFNTGWEHTYRIMEQEIWLENDPDLVVRVNDIIAAVKPLYSVEKEETRLKEASVPKLRTAVEKEAQELLKRILLGQDQRQYSDEEFAQAALALVFQNAQQHHIGEDDFEKVTIERSVKFLGLEVRVEDALERIYVTYELVERVNGQPWSTAVVVPNSRRTQFIGGRIFEGFEQMLWFWGYNKAAVVMEYFSIGVAGLAVIAVAWEVGLIAGAVELAGGWTVVGISIGISELFFAYRVIFKGEEFTWRGFFMAALDGYLAALAFRGAGFLGRGLAGKIGTESVKTMVVGWISEKMVVGVVGGASTGLLITFSHDLVNIATGTGGWSSASQYIEHMEDGAVLGLLVELFVGAMAPLARAGGRTALETGTEVLQAVRAGRISGMRLMLATTEALGNMRRSLANALETGSAENVINAFRERLIRISQSVSQEYRLALFRRVLEINPAALTRETLDGLERLLNVSRADLTNESILALFNRLNPTQLRAFLEAVNVLDNPLLNTLVRSNQLEALAASPSLAGTIRYDPVLTQMLLDTNLLSVADAAARARGLLAFARAAPQVPETFQLGPQFARGGTSTVYEVAGRPDLLAKIGGGRLPREAQSMIELEMMGIDTVYAATRRIDGQTHIVVRRIDGVGSKEMIGRVHEPLNPPQFPEVVTQRTINDLERIHRILSENKTNVPDFQFIVRRSDGAVFVNDPANLLTRGTGPSGSIRNIIDRYKKILRDNMSPRGGG